MGMESFVSSPVLSFNGPRRQSNSGRITLQVVVFLPWMPWGEVASVGTVSLGRLGGVDVELKGCVQMVRSSPNVSFHRWLVEVVVTLVAVESISKLLVVDMCSVFDRRRRGSPSSISTASSRCGRARSQGMDAATIRKNLLT